MTRKRSQSPLEARNGTGGYPPTDNPTNGPSQGAVAQQSALLRLLGARLDEYGGRLDVLWGRVLATERDLTDATNERIELLERIEALEAASAKPAEEASPNGEVFYAVWKDGRWLDGMGKKTRYPELWIEQPLSVAKEYGGKVVVLRVEGV